MHFGRTFPSATITPKMHMFQDHAVEWVKVRNVDFGLLGEQGAESIHARHSNHVFRNHELMPRM